MNIVLFNPKKRAFDKRKKKRLDKQKATWAYIQSCPIDEWAERLFQAWPDDLPNYLLSRAPVSVLGEYSFFCAEKLSFKLFEEDVEFLQKTRDHDNVKETYAEAREIFWDEHQENVGNLIGFFHTLTRPEIIISQTDYFLMAAAQREHEAENHYIMSLEDKMEIINQQGHQVFGFDFHSLNNDGRKFLEDILCVGMTQPTEIHVQTKLPFRVLKTHAEKGDTWVHQEKMYHFSLIDGTIYPLKSSDPRSVEIIRILRENDPEIRENLRLGDTHTDFKAFLNKANKPKTNFKP